jgi:hypothetical protein
MSRSKELIKNKKKPNKSTEQDTDETTAKQTAVCPAVMKEFLSRFPEYRSRSILPMVQTALNDTINWKKRVRSTCVVVVQRTIRSILEYRLRHIE